MARAPVLLAGALASLLLPAAAGAVPTGDPVTVAEGLRTPWEVAPTPDGRTLVVERDQGVRVLDAQDRLQTGSVLARSAVAPDATKLLGLVLHPGYATNRRLYLYAVRSADPDGTGPATGTSGIWRLRDEGSRLVVEQQVFRGIDSDGNHDGGRMAFGPDGALYVTTGDIHQPARPQDHGSLNGKILRFAPPSGSETELAPAADNPFAAEGGNARYVWSLGHRHPQGIAFDAAGRLWETEHGPTGEQHGAAYPGGNDQQGRDELNLIVRGGNYGWPLVSGPMTRAGTIAPLAYAPDDGAWAPGDVAVGRDGSLYAPFLRGSQLRRFDVRAGAVIGQAQHLQGLGRLRVAVARGDHLLVAQDGNAAKLLRLPLSEPTPGGSDAADPPAGPGGGPGGGDPGGGTGGGTGGSGTPAVPSATTASARLARGLRTAATRLGKRRLRVGRGATTRAALPAGRVTVELRLRSSRGPRLSRTTRTVPRGTTRTWAIRADARGRRLLRRTASRRIVVRVVARPTGGATVVRASGGTLRR